MGARAAVLAGVVVALGIAEAGDAARAQEPVAREAVVWPVKARIVNVMPQGERSVLIINAGTLKGVRVDDVLTMKGKRCILKEVYEHRSKCVIDIDDNGFGGEYGVAIMPPDRLPRRELRARVIGVSGPGYRRSVMLDVGFAAGVRPDDEGVVNAMPCAVWQVRETRSWCSFADGQPVNPRTATLSIAAVSGGTLGPGEAAFTTKNDLRELDPPEPPPPGARAAAPRVDVVRAYGTLLWSHECVGFARDGESAYLLDLDWGSSTDLGPPKVRLWRIDRSSGRASIERTYGYDVPIATFTRELDALTDKLYACHQVESWSEEETAPGRRGYRADHGKGKRTDLWFEGNVLHGGDPHEEGRQLVTVEQGTWPHAPIEWPIYYLPGAPMHLFGYSAGAMHWFGLDVEPR